MIQWGITRYNVYERRQGLFCRERKSLSCGGAYEDI